jgi:hypothetical protein
VASYYIYDWSILMMDRVLHIAGLLFAFKYIVEAHKIAKNVYVEKDINANMYSKKILA